MQLIWFSIGADTKYMDFLECLKYRGPISREWWGMHTFCLGNSICLWTFSHNRWTLSFQPVHVWCVPALFLLPPTFPPQKNASKTHFFLSIYIVPWFSYSNMRKTPVPDVAKRGIPRMSDSFQHISRGRPSSLYRMECIWKECHLFLLGQLVVVTQSHLHNKRWTVQQT